MAEYPYNKPAADPNAPWDTVECHLLDAACTAAGVPGVQGSFYDGTTITVHTAADLSGPEETLLAATVAAYTQNNSPLKLDTYLANPGRVDHRAVDFTTGLSTRLAKYTDTSDPTAWFRGEVRRVEYHSDPAHTDKVVDVVTEWARNADGTLVVVNAAAAWGDGDFRGSRTTWTWYRQDGTAHPDTKVAVRTYTGLESMYEGRNRRQAVIDNLSATVLGLLLATGGTEADGIAYLDKYATPISTYIRSGDLSFKVAPAAPNITDDVEAWLDTDVEAQGYPASTTIRDVILDALQGVMD